MAGGEEQVKTQISVADDGRVTIPFIGKVPAKGLTLSELEKEILIPLERDYFVDPQVHLQITGYHSLQFFISGAVGNPGMFELDFIPTIMDLFAKVGGVLPTRGSVAYILRGPGREEMSKEKIEESLAITEPIKIDLVKLLDEGDMSENIKLQPGDTVYIPLGSNLDQTHTKVYVEGRVKSPGIFPYQPGMTALGACILSGGFEKFAAPNRTKIIRGTKEGQEIIEVNLDKVQTGDNPDVLLKPGDRIHVPESWL